MAAVSEAVRQVVENPSFAAKFKHPVKFNGKDFVEERLTTEQQFQEVSKLATSKLHVFLERYGSMLPEGTLRALSRLPEADSGEVQFWIERLLRAPLSNDRRLKQARRRRWAWARKEMARPDGFFCEDEMKRRDPQLFHRIIGKHADSGLRLSAPMQGSLSAYLIQQMEKECEDEDLAAARRKHVTEEATAGAPAADGDATAGGAPPAAGGDAAAQDKQPVGGTGAGKGAAASAEAQAKKGKGPQVQAMEEDSEGSDLDLDDMPSSPLSGDEPPVKRQRSTDQPPPDDATVRRARFLKLMRNRFVEGREPGFNYADLDEDSELDDVVELGRDAEDKYFDDD